MAENKWVTGVITPFTTSRGPTLYIQNCLSAESDERCRPAMSFALRFQIGSRPRLTCLDIFVVQGHRIDLHVNTPENPTRPTMGNPYNQPWDNMV